MTEPAVLPAIAALREEMVTLRRHIHAHPELGFEERRTAALVAECLEAWGYQVSRGVGRTGVVGTLCRGEGPALGLPPTWTRYRSRKPPACPTPARWTA